MYVSIDGQKLIRDLDPDLDTLQEWERTWDMEFNPN